MLPAQNVAWGIVDRGNRKRLKVSRLPLRSMQSKQQQKLNFCWQSNDKRSVQPWDGVPYRASKRHRRALPYLFPMAALPRVFCCSEIREWNDPALVFWL